MVKAWLDEKTREKIQIVGGSYKKKLLIYVDEDQLVDFMGGKNTATLEDDFGPWNDFEIVDGTEKTDKVGIRRKGETEICFSPDDLLKLPNYMTSTSAVNPAELADDDGEEFKQEEEERKE